MSRHPHIVNVDEMEWNVRSHGERFLMRHKWIGNRAGGKKLGCSLYRIEPGKTAFPFHFHHANDEAMFILEGEGTLRLGEERYPVRKGDYIAYPAGEKLGHQLINTSSAPLEYLCMSTLINPEIVEYPDSNKVGVLAGTFSEPAYRGIFKRDTTVDYYEGE